MKKHKILGLSDSPLKKTEAFSSPLQLPPSLSELQVVLRHHLLSAEDKTETAGALQDAYQIQFPLNRRQWNPRAFRHYVFQLKGPSAAGKSTLAHFLKESFEEKSKPVTIVERDVFMEIFLDDYNQKNPTKKITLESMNDRQNRRMTPIRNAINTAVDDAMVDQVRSAIEKGHIVIWDTMKSMPKTLLFKQTLFIGLEVCCLDDPETRDYIALSQRKSGVMAMTEIKQKKLATLTLSPGKGTIQEQVTFFYGWSQEGYTIAPHFQILLEI